MRGPLAALALSALAGLGGCRGQSSSNQSSRADASSAAPASLSVSAASARADSRPFTRSPLSQAELATTDGALEREAMDGQIRSAEKLVGVNPRDTSLKEALIAHITTRGDFLGRVADYERALALAEELVKADPKSPGAYLARAGARATFHRWSEALEDLNEAEQRKGRADFINAKRASVFAGMGRLDEALALLHAASQAHPTTQTLTSEAAVLGQMGRFDEAERLFIEAQSRFRDVSALPIAWLYFQEAMMWERAQRPARAKELYAAAVSRLPSYAHAAAHLAAMEPYARGIELLAPIVAQADDPEPLSVLADLLRKKGDAALADEALAKAKARYEELVAAHPEAYADHAARFWLNAGGDPKKALSLAKKNLEVRKTEAAFDLALMTALSAGSKPDACAAAKGGLALPYLTDLFRRTAEHVTAECP